MNPLATPETIASEFANVLNDWLTEYEMSEVLRLNGSRAYAACCASHDFCDANMAMIHAFSVITDCDLDLENDAHFDLCNAAWTYAKVNHLTKKD